MWAESASTLWDRTTAAARLLWCSTKHSATALTPLTSPWVRGPPSSSTQSTPFSCQYYFAEENMRGSALYRSTCDMTIKCFFFILNDCVADLVRPVRPTDENLSVCWQQVTADLVCQSPLLLFQVTFMDCCCLYGLGWGMECALCPPADSGKIHLAFNRVRILLKN